MNGKKRNRLILGVILTLLTVAYIVVLRTVDVAAIGPAGTSVGLSRLNGAVSERIGTHMICYKITEVLGYMAILLAAAIAVFGAVQLIRRRSLAKVDKNLLLTGALYATVVILYVLFEKVIINYRPVIMPGDELPEASFPSSHTMISCTVLGSAMMLLKYYVKNLSVRRALQAVMGVAIAVTVCGRLISGVHWLTDIVGGLLISATLLTFYRALLWNKKRRRRRGTAQRRAAEAA